MQRDEDNALASRPNLAQPAQPFRIYLHELVDRLWRMTRGPEQTEQRGRKILHRNARDAALFGGGHSVAKCSVEIGPRDSAQVSREIIRHQAQPVPQTDQRTV